jgi:hypothetical protein
LAEKTLVLPDLHVGDAKTIRIATSIASGDDAGEPKNPGAESTFLCFDPDRATTGAAHSGSATTLVDADRDEDDDFWVGMTLVVTDVSDDREYVTEVTAFDQATHTLTFYSLPVTVAEGDRYRIEGYPLLPQTPATISGNEASVQVTPSDVTGTPGRRTLIYRADFGTDSEEVVATFRLLPSTAGVAVG